MAINCYLRHQIKILKIKKWVFPLFYSKFLAPPIKTFNIKITIFIRKINKRIGGETGVIKGV
jgi:hypothetical protein